MNWKDSISNLEEKDNFYILMDFVLRKISTGIRGYSIIEMQQLGKIVNLLNRQNILKYNDDRIPFLINS